METVELLYNEAMPNAIDIFKKYKCLANQKCSGEQTQLLAELDRRINYLAYLLDNIAFLQRQAQNDVINDIKLTLSGQTATGQISLERIHQMRFLAESFYWISHKIIAVINAQHKSYEGKKLPGITTTLKCPGVTNVRNHLIEHPFTANETFSTGGMWTGPMFGGGTDSTGKNVTDPGLNKNALELAQQLAKVLEKAIAELEQTKTNF